MNVLFSKNYSETEKIVKIRARLILSKPGGYWLCHMVLLELFRKASPTKNNDELRKFNLFS